MEHFVLLGYYYLKYPFVIYELLQDLSNQENSGQSVLESIGVVKK